MGRFQIGSKKPENSGRKKGTANKTSSLLKEVLDSNNCCPVEELLKILKDDDPLKKINPVDKAKIYLELISYLFPKRKPQDNVPLENKQIIQFIALDNFNSKTGK